MVVRCACGVQAVIWKTDFENPRRSSGCRSNICREQHRIVQEMKLQSTAWKSVDDVREFLDKYIETTRIEAFQAQFAE